VARRVLSADVTFWEAGTSRGVTVTALHDATAGSDVPTGGGFQVHVRDPVLVRALWHVLSDLGDLWPAGKVLTVCDEHAAGSFDVLVVSPTPFACSAAVRRATEGAVSVVVTTDRLDDLAPALHAMRGEVVHLPRRVLELANQLPALDRRDIEILRGLLVDPSISGLARRVGISDATLKRCLTSLMNRVGAASRAALVARTVQLGLVPARSEHP
jgi:hypothetical protein